MEQHYPQNWKQFLAALALVLTAGVCGLMSTEWFPKAVGEILKPSPNQSSEVDSEDTSNSNDEDLQSDSDDVKVVVSCIGILIMPLVLYLLYFKSHVLILWYINTGLLDGIKNKEEFLKNEDQRKFLENLALLELATFVVSIFALFVAIS